MDQAPVTMTAPALYLVNSSGGNDGHLNGNDDIHNAAAAAAAYGERPKVMVRSSSLSSLEARGSSARQRRQRRNLDEDIHIKSDQQHSTANGGGGDYRYQVGQQQPYGHSKHLLSSSMRDVSRHNHSQDADLDAHANPDRNSSSFDALMVQRTYQRISKIGGVPRDGFVEGIELTRSRRASAIETANGLLTPESLAAMPSSNYNASSASTVGGEGPAGLPNGSGGHSRGEDEANDGAGSDAAASRAFGNLLDVAQDPRERTGSSRRSSAANRISSSTSLSPEEFQRAHTPVVTEYLSQQYVGSHVQVGPADASRVAAAPASGNTTRNVSVGSKYTVAKTEMEENEEYRLLQQVDRYGFFQPTYGKFQRLALLRKQECAELPPKNLDRQQRRKRPSLGLGHPASSSRSSLRHQSANGPLANGSSSSSRHASGPYLTVPGRMVSESNNGSGSSTNGWTTNGSNSLASSTMSWRSPAHGPAAPTANGSSRTSISSISRNDNSGIRGFHPSESALSNMTTPWRSLQKESSRISKWQKEMLVPGDRDSGGNIISWRLAGVDEKKLLRRIVKGIPDRWRAAGWEALIVRMQSSSSSSPSRSRQSMAQLASGRAFYDLILRPCTHDVQIDLDVPRTISGHLYFHTRYGLGQRSLFNVLHAFALLCPTCGYCQGMGSVAATLLCYLTAEKAYAAMVALHDTYGLHDIYQPGFPGMLECFAAQEALVRAMMPDVHAVFDKNFITPTSFATKWYITLFSNCISFSTQLRIYDLFLLSGLDVLVLLSTGIIWMLRSYLVDPKADFESILSLLSSFFVPEDEDKLLKWLAKMLRRQDVRSLIRSARDEFRRSLRTAEDGGDDNTNSRKKLQ